MPASFRLYAPLQKLCSFALKQWLRAVPKGGCFSFWCLHSAYFFEVRLIQEVAKSLI